MCAFLQKPVRIINRLEGAGFPRFLTRQSICQPGFLSLLSINENLRLAETPLTQRSPRPQSEGPKELLWSVQNSPVGERLIEGRSLDFNLCELCGRCVSSAF